MTSEFMKKKLTYTFNAYDATQNGVLEKDDFEKLAIVYAEGLGFAKGSKESNDIIAQEVHFFEFIVQHCDANNDGKITLEEFINGMEAWKKKPDFESFLKEYAKSLLNSLDKDKNGRIEFEEFLPFLGIKDEAKGRKIFNAIDTDGSGYLDLDELTHAWREYCTSEDPSAPLNYMFGFKG